MANSSHTGQREGVQAQTEQSSPVQRLEDMPMNRYIHQIPRCRDWEVGYCQIRELLECQARLLGEILAVLDEMVEKEGT